MEVIVLLLIIGVGCWDQPLPWEKHSPQMIAALSPRSEILGRSERGAYSDNMHHPWMDTMRSLGVKRAIVVLNFEWRGRPEKITPERTLYFSKYDTECAQITDPNRLSEIHASGIEKQLEAFAIQTTSNAHWFYVDKKPHAKQGTSRVELMDDESLPNAPPILRPSEGLHRSALFGSISLGDESRVSAIIARSISRSELDGALFMAASSIDDSCIINMLLKAGANPNAQNAEKQTPLMYASGSGYIYNVKALLGAGADVNAQNASGNAAIVFARTEGHSDVVRLLEQAQARK